MKKKPLPTSIRLKIRILRHNLNVFLGKNKAGAYIKVRKIGNIWQLQDGLESIFMPDLASWIYFQSGIEAVRKKRFEAYFGNSIGITKEDLVIDIGANVGDFSVKCIELGASVICFEPELKTFSALEKNINASPKATLHQVALSNKAGTATFYEAAGSNDSSMFIPANSAYHEIIVKTIRLDKILPKNQFIRLIKCDAEGFEPEVLEGALGILKNVEWVSIDCGKERNGQSTQDDVITILK